MHQSSYTSFSLIINHEVKIHANVDDDNICFILWIHGGMLIVWISFHHFLTVNDNHKCLNWSQNAENGLGTNGQATFCLPEFEVKFETKNEAIFMFRANKVLHSLLQNVS